MSGIDSFADTFLGTLKKIKSSLIPEEEGEERASADGEETPEEHHEHRHHHGDKHHRKGHHHHHGRHSRDHSPGDSLHVENVTNKRPSQTYEPNNKGKDGTLLAIASHKPEGPNSESGKRTRSMRLANSMNSVYRKIRNDKNIHNDRHYLVAVTEHLKEEVPEKGKK